LILNDFSSARCKGGPASGYRNDIDEDHVDLGGRDAIRPARAQLEPKYDQERDVEDGYPPRPLTGVSAATSINSSRLAHRRSSTDQRTVHLDRVAESALGALPTPLNDMPIDFAFSAMAKRSDRHPAAWRRPFIHWLNGIEAGWSVPLLLVCFVAVWTAYLSIAYLGAGLHPDVLEAWTFGRHFAWGYLKHPPLMGWVAGTWTSLFPLADWSLQLMAITNAALALWFVDLISRRLVVGDKRVIVLLLLMLTPTYQFHAQRFNANSVLLAAWPLATYCFLRAFETKATLWAIAAGLAVAVAMLGKYYSIFLVGSFVLAALAHPMRRAYFTSASPWISAAVGLVALSLHLRWLALTGAAPFHYALMHANADVLTSFQDCASFLMGLAAAMSGAAITWIMIAGYRIRRFSADFAAMKPSLTLLYYIAIGTIGLPIVTSLLVGTDLPSLWAFQGMFLFVVLVVCGASYRIERFYTVNATVLVAGIAVVAVIIAAPVHALYRNSHGYEEGRSFYHQAANEVTRRWHQLTEAPLTIVGGDGSLGLATAFYSPDHPHYGQPFAYRYKSELPGNTGFERGWAALCFQDQADCLDWVERMAIQAGDFVRSELALQSQLLGVSGGTRNVVVFMVTPRKTPNASQNVTRCGRS
jgi:4-amino-4-deoxy-L-arabinose transferase-like glycosyltransferase